MQTTLDRPAAAMTNRFDVDDYHRMAAAGIRGPEHRVEVIEGEIVDRAPIGSEHNGVTDFLSSLVARAFADGKVHVRVQGSLRLDPHNEPQPELMLLRPRGLPSFGPPDRRRRTASGRGRRQLARLRPRPQARPLRPPRRTRGVGGRSRGSGGRRLPRARPGRLCRAWAMERGFGDPHARAGVHHRSCGAVPAVGFIAL